MRTISVAVSKADYEAFRRAARREKRPIAQLIRDAMAHYRREKLEVPERLTRLPEVSGHRPVASLPSRAEVYEEILERP